LSQPETSIAEAETGTVLTHPLDEFCRLAKRPLPGIERVDGAALPEPYRSLLVHERDMTSTLGQFHGDDIGLKVLHRHNGGDAFFREVLLLAKRDWRPVEYGAIKINLGQFPEPARDAITGAAAPLGQLLHDYSIGHLSRPSGFLRVECDDYIGGLFELGDRPLLFGRRNTLYDATGKRCLAEIVEILPPA
jgi:hypothetical protein